MTRTPNTFRYVLHARVPDYLRCGWLATPALEGTHHGYYSVLMVWLCGCELPQPDGVDYGVKYGPRRCWAGRYENVLVTFEHTCWP